MSDALLLLVLYLLLLWCLVTYRHRLLAWLDLQLFRHQLQWDKPKRRAPRCPFPTKRPDCPLCQAEETEQDIPLPPEPAVIPPPEQGRPRCVDTQVHFCPEESCAYYGWLAKGNITSNGFPNSGQHRQLRCKACRKLFSETTGTLFYGLKTPPETVLLALKMLAEGLDLEATARVLGVKEATVQYWLALASAHMETVSAYLIQELHVSQVQVDEMWSLLGKRDAEQPEQRKTRWLWSAVDSDSKLWLAYLIADRSIDAAQSLPSGNWGSSSIKSLNCWPKVAFLYSCPTATSPTRLPS